MLYLKQLISRDKTVTHPLLGTVTCSGLQDSYYSCLKLFAKSGFYQSQCNEFYVLGMSFLSSPRVPLQSRVRVHVLHRRESQREALFE